MKFHPWTAAERRRLARLFPDATSAALRAAFPRRTRGAIYRQAGKLGLRRASFDHSGGRARVWTPEQDEQLRQRWPDTAWRTLVAFFRRTRRAISLRAAHLGLAGRVELLARVCARRVRPCARRCAARPCACATSRPPAGEACRAAPRVAAGARSASARPCVCGPAATRRIPDARVIQREPSTRWQGYVSIHAAAEACGVCAVTLRAALRLYAEHYKGLGRRARSALPSPVVIARGPQGREPRRVVDKSAAEAALKFYDDAETVVQAARRLGADQATVASAARRLGASVKRGERRPQIFWDRVFAAGAPRASRRAA